VPSALGPADVEFASPTTHYLSSITVNSGKVYAMFVKSPERVSAAHGQGSTHTEACVTWVEPS
jgi:hypothetical protein